MVDLDQKIVGINKEYTAISTWEVWFQTPFGLIRNFDEAVLRCKTNDLDPNMVIQPVPVAVGAFGYTEVVMR